jgi:hypothetical protein
MYLVIVEDRHTDDIYRLYEKIESARKDALSTMSGYTDIEDWEVYYDLPEKAEGGIFCAGYGDGYYVNIVKIEVEEV